VPEDYAKTCTAILAIFKSVMDRRSQTWIGRDRSLGQTLKGAMPGATEDQIKTALQQLLKLQILQVVHNSRGERWKLLMPDAKIEQEGTKLKAFRQKTT
jgi:hypothetical protein